MARATVHASLQVGVVGGLCNAPQGHPDAPVLVELQVELSTWQQSPCRGSQGALQGTREAFTQAAAAAAPARAPPGVGGAAGQPNLPRCQPQHRTQGHAAASMLSREAPTPQARPSWPRGAPHAVTHSLCTAHSRCSPPSSRGTRPRATRLELGFLLLPLASRRPAPYPVHTKAMWGATQALEAGGPGTLGAVWAPESQTAGWSSAAELLASQQQLAPLQPSGSPTTPGPWASGGLAPEGPGQGHSAASKIYVQVRGGRFGWQPLQAAAATGVGPSPAHASRRPFNTTSPPSHLPASCRACPRLCSTQWRWLACSRPLETCWT